MPPNLSPLTPPWQLNPRKQPKQQQQPESSACRPMTVGEWQNTYPSAGFGRPKRLPGPGRYEPMPPIRQHDAPAGRPKMIEGPARFEFGGWGMLPKHPRPVMPHMRSDVDVCLFGRDLDTSDDFQESELTGHMKLKPTHNSYSIENLKPRVSQATLAPLETVSETRVKAKLRAMGLESPRRAPRARAALPRTAASLEQTRALAPPRTPRHRARLHLRSSAAQLWPAAEPVDADP